MNARADLHVHTTASDGQCTPEQVVEMARALGLRAIAITDHETTLGVRPAQEAAAGTGVDVVPGVEISTDSAMGELHVLGYFIEPDGDGLEGRLHALREGRLRRARRMVEKLAALGLPLPWARVRELAGGESVGRPHVARALLEMGYVASTDEAFARYIGTHGPAYVSRTRVKTVEAIVMIRRAHGVPVLAHPIQATGIVPDLVKAGLQGLEVHYPGYSREEVHYLEGLAHRYRLMVTGGSDFHGPEVLPVELAAATVPYETVELLRSRRPQAAQAQ